VSTKIKGNLKEKENIEEEVDLFIDVFGHYQYFVNRL
jgi:hypothetical protein